MKTAEKKENQKSVSKTINGVQLIPIQAHHDDRGYLMEIFRKTDPCFNKFGQVYLVGNMTRGTIRAFHKHEVLWDYFFISHGSAKFALRDDRPDSPTYEMMNTFVIGDRKPGLLVIPPGVFHGWMSLQDDTQMISIASEVYNHANPDEVRVPPDSFGFVWEVKGR
ncbi:MAG: dTDP-4-dehydrorhamnose 3,5-epimerase family protein [Candidatus Omnitrophica bacterium]|nr:dTDP-4-dehydrorhamnose 3,5-epimerase family protein [Candidatus Omnitrophota bacterium]